MLSVARSNNVTDCIKIATVMLIIIESKRAKLNKQYFKWISENNSKLSCIHLYLIKLIAYGRKQSHSKNESTVWLLVLLIILYKSTIIHWTETHNNLGNSLCNYKSRKTMRYIRLLVWLNRPCMRTNNCISRSMAMISGWMCFLAVRSPKMITTLMSQIPVVPRQTQNCVVISEMTLKRNICFPTSMLQWIPRHKQLSMCSSVVECPGNVLN